MVFISFFQIESYYALKPPDVL